MNTQESYRPYHTRHLPDSLRERIKSLRDRIPKFPTMEQVMNMAITLGTEQLEEKFPDLNFKKVTQVPDSQISPKRPGEGTGIAKTETQSRMIPAEVDEPVEVI